MTVKLNKHDFVIYLGSNLVFFSHYPFTFIHWVQFFSCLQMKILDRGQGCDFSGHSQVLKSPTVQVIKCHFSNECFQLKFQTSFTAEASPLVQLWFIDSRKLAFGDSRLLFSPWLPSKPPLPNLAGRRRVKGNRKLFTCQCCDGR